MDQEATRGKKPFKIGSSCLADGDIDLKQTNVRTEVKEGQRN